MAGPCACVYLPTSIDASVIDAVRNTCASISDTVEGDDFWVTSTISIYGRYTGEGRPFILTVNDASDELGDDVELFEDALGWRPQLAVGFAAMCNQQQDHQILAELCVFVCRRFGGVITMHGDFDLICRNREFRSQFFSHSGVATVVYDDDSREHLMSDELLELWMDHPEFRMLK